MEIKIECINAKPISMDAKEKLVKLASQIAWVMGIPESSVTITGFHFDSLLNEQK